MNEFREGHDFSRAIKPENVTGFSPWGIPTCLRGLRFQLRPRLGAWNQRHVRFRHCPCDAINN
jgi:hypothetical protein